MPTTAPKRIRKPSVPLPDNAEDLKKAARAMSAGDTAYVDTVAESCLLVGYLRKYHVGCCLRYWRSGGKWVVHLKDETFGSQKNNQNKTRT